MDRTEFESVIFHMGFVKAPPLYAGASPDYTNKRIKIIDCVKFSIETAQRKACFHICLNVPRGWVSRRFEISSKEDLINNMNLVMSKTWQDEIVSDYIARHKPRKKDRKYPFEYDGKLWNREDCNELWRDLYEEGCGLGYDGDEMAIYLSDGCYVTPHPDDDGYLED